MIRAEICMHDEVDLGQLIRVMDRFHGAYSDFHTTAWIEVDTEQDHKLIVLFAEANPTSPSKEKAQ